MWMMLQAEIADDYVIATGESHSVEEFLHVAAEYLNIDWRRYVVTDPRYLRPAEVDYLLGDPTKAKRALDWEHTMTFSELVRYMVDSDMQLAQQESTLRNAGLYGRIPAGIPS